MGHYSAEVVPGRSAAWSAQARNVALQNRDR